MIIIATVLIIDFITKYLISNNMKVNESIEIIHNVFDITYVQNTGAAWGIMSSKSNVLTVVIIALLVLLLVYTIKSKPKKYEKAAIMMIIAGGVGNLISRFVHGYVIDFLNIHIIPVFNVADISICIGCALLILAIFVLEKDE